jgi:hypothetical protein
VKAQEAEEKSKPAPSKSEGAAPPGSEKIEENPRFQQPRLGRPQKTTQAKSKPPCVKATR